MSETKTLKEYLLEKKIISRRVRIEKLTEIKAPEVILEHENALLAKLESGDVMVNGIEEFSEITEFTFEKRIGRGGTPWFEITTPVGILNYFPNARFGAFIKRAQE